jgi:hypothetical protein
MEESMRKFLSSLAAFGAASLWALAPSQAQPAGVFIPQTLLDAKNDGLVTNVQYWRRWWYPGLPAYGGYYPRYPVYGSYYPRYPGYANYYARPIYHPYYPSYTTYAAPAYYPQPAYYAQPTYYPPAAYYPAPVYYAAPVYALPAPESYYYNFHRSQVLHGGGW